MKVTLLGTGTPAPNQERRQAAVLIEVGDASLLVDAGRGTLHQMARAAAPPERVRGLFITHHHFDHIGEVFDVALTSALCGREETLEIAGPSGTEEIVRALFDVVYARDLRSRVLADASARARGLGTGPVVSFDRVACRDVGPGLVAETDRWRVTAERVRHGDFDDAPDFDWQCLAYRIEADDRSVVVSGDTVPCAGLERLARDADLLIQCAHFPGARLDDPVVRDLTEHTLPSAAQAGEIAARANVKHLVLTHLSASIDGPAALDAIRAEASRAFSGPVTAGHDLLELRP